MQHETTTSRFLESWARMITIRINANGLSRHPASWHVQKPCPDFNLWYILQGNYCVSIQGRMFNLAKGDLFLIPPGSEYAAHCQGRRSSQLFIHFDAVMGNNPHFFHAKNLSAINTGGIISANESAMIKKNYFAYAAGEELSEYFLETAIAMVVIRLLRRLWTADMQPRMFALAELTNWIETHLEQPLRISELARRMHMHSASFSTLFKKWYGISPKKYVVERRMRRGRQLLTENALSVKEIAYKLGFADQFVFSHAFKRRHGTAPSQFRRMMES